MIRIFTFSLMTLLLACSNSVDQIDGFPNIDITGVVLNGNVRDASVQVVGIDNYGQPQRNADGEIYADRFFTDANGRYNLAINGVATGSLLFIVKSYSEEGRKTQIRCALKDGCIDEDKASVDYGDWYDAPADFELWAVVNDAQSISKVHVSPITHLAARLAFSDFTWDGNTGVCEDYNSGAGTCNVSLPLNGMFTPQSIHEANTRVKALFNSDSSIHAFLEPFSPFFTSGLDTVSVVDGAKHGLLNLTWQYQAREENLTLSEVLDDWLNDAFLANSGQLYGDDQTNTPAQWDLKTAFDNASAIQTEMALPDNAALTSAASSFNTISATLTNVITSEKGADYLDNLAEQVTAAREFVENAQGWINGYNNGNLVPFLDNDTAAEVSAMEAQWEAMQAILGPELQSVFLPVVETVHYALVCSANASCGTEPYVFSDPGASISYDATTKRFSYTNTFSQTLVRGELLSVGDNGLIKSFSFTQDVKVESDAGLSILQSRTNNKASIGVYLDSVLVSGSEPAIKRIEFSLPQITIKAKESLGNSDYQDLVYTADNASLVMQGVKDPTRPDMPIHFNLESLLLLGQVSNGSDVLDVDVTLNGSNAAIHYPAQRFPDLNFVWRGSDIKRYGQFDDTGLDAAQLAGWLALPSDVTLNEVLAGEVIYQTQAQFSNLDTALKSELNVSNYHQFEFGELQYPGGSTGLAIYKRNASDSQFVRQCNAADGAWLCSDEVALADLGCDGSFKNDSAFTSNASASDAFVFLQKSDCIPQVKIVGRGVYDIQYPINLDAFTSGDSFDVKLIKPHYLGLSSFNIRLLSRFKDGQNNLDETPVLLNILGAFTDTENVSIAFSVTHDFIGYGNTSSLGLVEVIPYGERTLWFAVGNSDQTDEDSVVYYILDNNVSLVMSGFDFRSSDGYHDQPLGYIRYAGALMGTLRQEGDLYVVRYIDGSWQLL